MGVEDAAEIRRLLGYKDGTAGGMMTTQFVAVPETFTVRETIEVLRELPEEHPTVHYVYVLDEYDKLVGVLSLRTLVLTDDSKVMHDIMYTDLITASPDETEDDVAADVFKYDLPAMPVVDERGKLLGIVTGRDYRVSRMELTEKVKDFMTPFEKTKKSVLLGLGATAAAILFLVLYTLVLFQIIGYSWR